MVFPGVQKTTWTRDAVAKEWYFHRFYDFQPDLNTSNPAVQAEILKIMGFWIQLGVSGFRMDAVPFVIGTKGADVEQAARAVRHAARRSANSCNGASATSIILAEANVLPNTDMQYFGDDGDRMHMMFNFQVNQNLFYALASSDTRPLAKAMQKTEKRPASGQWGIFLRNHDELDLGRLTETQRQQVFDAFGPNKEDQLYDRGIRRRLAPMLGGDRRRIELAYSLMFTLPGTPVLRYGDELGMGDDLVTARARLLPHADAMVDRAEWRLHQERQADRAGHQRRPLRLSARQRRRAAPRSELDAELDRTHHPHAQGGAGDRLGRVQGARRPATMRCSALRYDWRNNSVLFLHNFAGEPREVAFSTGLKGEDDDMLINLLAARPQPGRRRTASTASVSRLTAIAGTASAGSTICSSAASSSAASRIVRR